MSKKQTKRIAILMERWITHPETGPDEIAVLAALALHADQRGQCYPRQKTLAQLLNRSRSWVNKMIGRLAEIGLLEKTRQRDRDGLECACLYQLVLHETESVTEQSQESFSEKQPVSPPITPAVPTNDTIKTQQKQSIDSRPPEHPIQKNWRPREETKNWIHQRYPDLVIDQHITLFIEKCLAKGYRYRDFDAAWKAWVVEDYLKKEARKRARSSRKSTGTAFEQRVEKETSRLNTWLSVADGLTDKHSPGWA